MLFRRLTLSVTLGAFIFTASCAETNTEEAAETAPAAAAPVEEVPLYELTKDEITSHPDWSSKNITFKGLKIGEKSKPTIEKALGQGEKTDNLPSQYRTMYDKSSFAIYTFKQTGELQKVEIFSKIADQVADPKLKKLLSSGDLKFMRDTFGMEEKSEQNFDTTAMEYIYDSKGFRFAQYNLGGQKVNALLFSKLVKKAEPEAAPAEPKK